MPHRSISTAYQLSLKRYALTEGSLKQGPKGRERWWGFVFGEGAEPRKKLVLVYFGLQNSPILSTTHYPPVIVLLSLGLTVFGQVGLKSQQGRPKPEQVGRNPP